jgi:uncharacterized protein (DUF2345 family)
LAGVVGSVKAGQSALDPQAAPLKALQRVLGSMVDARDELQAAADTAERHPAGDERVPHTGEPVLAVTARAGLAVVAGQAVQLAAGEGITLASGEDTQWAVGGAARVHAGQAIGVLGGAVKPGEQAAGMGLTMIAAQGDVQMQAQSGRMQVAAKDQVVVQSANAHIDWAAAKKITLATAGGASVVIEGGNITVQCPGTLTVKAGMKSFTGPQGVSYGLPAMPRAPLHTQDFKLDLRLTDVAGPAGIPVGHAAWDIALIRRGEVFERTLMSGESDADGRIALTDAQHRELAEIYAARPNDVWLQVAGDLRPLAVVIEQAQWTVDEKTAQALAALDYVDNPPAGFSSGVPEAGLARSDHAGPATALWQQLPKS